jgi:cell division protein FtsA
MARSKIHVGLEIGTSKICMVVGEVKSDGTVKILGLGHTKSAGVRKGEIYDYPQVKECLSDALAKAEDASDVEITNVFLAVTGGHISGVNNTGLYRLPENEKQINHEHVDEVKDIARDISLPADHVYLHNIIRSYRVDGFDHASSPVGLFGKTIETDFHIVHGMGARIQNSIKCVRELHVDIDDVVFSPIATAQLALNRDARDRGSLIIDIGGGATDYALYLNGSIAASGCVPVGGEHVTNDIHLVTGLSFSRAEQIKIKEGDVSGDPSRSVGFIGIAVDENGFAQQDIKRDLLNEVIRARMAEILDLVKKRLPDGTVSKIGMGVFLSGGSSHMRGINELTNQIFGRDVYTTDISQISGVTSNFKDPQFATALGLIRYAQLLEIEKESNKKTFLPKWLWPFGD